MKDGIVRGIFSEANPEKFNSRFRNKMFYAGVSASFSLCIFVFIMWPANTVLYHSWCESCLTVVRKRNVTFYINFSCRKEIRCFENRELRRQQQKVKAQIIWFSSFCDFFSPYSPHFCACISLLTGGWERSFKKELEGICWPHPCRGKYTVHHIYVKVCVCVQTFYYSQKVGKWAENIAAPGIKSTPLFLYIVWWCGPDPEDSGHEIALSGHLKHSKVSEVTVQASWHPPEPQPMN